MVLLLRVRSREHIFPTCLPYFPASAFQHLRFTLHAPHLRPFTCLKPRLLLLYIYVECFRHPRLAEHFVDFAHHILHRGYIILLFVDLQAWKESILYVRNLGPVHLGMAFLVEIAVLALLRLGTNHGMLNAIRVAMQCKFLVSGDVIEGALALEGRSGNAFVTGNAEVIACCEASTTLGRLMVAMVLMAMVLELVEGMPKELHKLLGCAFHMQSFKPYK